MSNEIFDVSQFDSKYGETESPTKTNVIPTFLCIIEGWKTKIKNLHWSASCMSMHKQLDEVADVISNYQDSLAEDYMGINGKLSPTFLSGVPCKCDTPLDLLINMCKQTNIFYSKIPTDSRYSGIKSETETLIHNINKQIYLIKLCCHE